MESGSPRAGGAGGEGSDTCTYHIGKHPVFPLARLQTLAEQQGYAAFCKAEEDKRCDADLMYKIFKRPESVVDTLLQGFHTIIKTKYSPDLEASRVFMSACDFLLNHPRCDPRFKVFYTLMIINNEEEAQTVIKAGYKNTEGNMWGDKWEAHFKSFLKELKALQEQLHNMGFGEPNVMERIEWFNNVAEIIYMSI